MFISLPNKSDGNAAVEQATLSKVGPTGAAAAPPVSPSKAARAYSEGDAGSSWRYSEGDARSFTFAQFVREIQERMRGCRVQKVARPRTPLAAATRKASGGAPRPPRARPACHPAS